MKPFFKYWLPVLVWGGFIFTVSSIQGEDLPCLFPCQNTLFHVFEYAVLAFLFSRALKNSRLGHLSKPRLLCIVILLCLVYAISDEFHQSFISGRENSLIDLIVDGSGIVLGSVIFPW